MANTVNVTTANTFEQWRVKTNELGTGIGDLDKVTNSDIGATTIVGALEAHQGIVAGSVTVAGSTMTGNLVFNDNAKVILGTSSDGLEIYHDGSHSYIADTGTGDLKFTAPTAYFSANVDVDGILEADAITVNGVTLAETISDTVGGMVGGNTETGIAVTYEDSDNTLDFALAAAQTTVTSLKNAALVIGRDADNDIDFSTDNNIVFRAGGGDQIKIIDGVLRPEIDSDVDLGTSAVRFKDAFVDSITVTGEIDGASLDISGNADIDGTLEADAITVGGVTLATTIATTVGAMVGSNTESGINVTYEASDNTLDFDVNDPVITLTGDVTGSATMTNLGSVSIATTVASSSVTTSDIVDLNVTTAKIANDAVTEAKIGDDAVGTDQLKSLSTLLIINSAGATVKTLHGAGA
jgi:cytoskeletal protein CcmA (bactofilin family)